MNVLALLLAAAVNLSVPVPDAKTIGQAACPDGRSLEIRLFDPDPEDPEAGLWEAWHGSQRIAAWDAKTKTIYVDAVRQTLPIEEVIKKWGESPCNLPDPGLKT